MELKFPLKNMSRKIINENSNELFNWIIRTFTEDGKSYYTFEIKDRTYQQAVKEAESEIERDSDVDDWTINQQ